MRKPSQHFAAILAFFLLSACLFPVMEVFALHNVVIPAEMQSQEEAPLKRTITLKLPIKDVQFHWEFLDRADLLAGKLLLRITREGKTEEIVIFQEGKFSDGWEPLIDQSLGKTGENPIYFGFKSQNTYLTAPGDKIEIELVVRQDIKGIGALLTGYLPAGTYKSETNSSWLTDGPQAELPTPYQRNAAYESWPEQWPLVVTGDEGWLPPEQAEQMRNLMKQF